jgi:4-diphosphocytidyl-2-C-methyl-D-erythritol kinase
MRAAVAFRDAFGGGPRLIGLDKRLPVAAGIGGGSADAAAVLRLLAAEAGVAVDDPRLLAIARRLGADVPACLFGRPCLAVGTGDRITPLRAFPEVAVVLANAGTAVPTAPVFRRWSQAPVPPPPSLDRHALESAADGAALARALAASCNALTAAAVALAPEIGRVLQRLAAADGCLMARMSGSGGTCFALSADAAAAERAAARIATDEPGWWVVPARLRGC